MGSGGRRTAERRVKDVYKRQVLLSGTWVGIFLYGVSNGTVKKTSNIILFIFAFMIIAEIIVILRCV